MSTELLLVIIVIILLFLLFRKGKSQHNSQQAQSGFASTLHVSSKQELAQAENQRYNHDVQYAIICIKDSVKWESKNRAERGFRNMDKKISIHHNGSLPNKPKSYQRRFYHDVQTGAEQALIEMGFLGVQTTLVKESGLFSYALRVRCRW